MAVSIPIISEFDGKGIKKAIAEFKQLETNAEKAQFLIKKSAAPAAAAVSALAYAAYDAAKAAMADQKAQQQLAMALQNSTGATKDQISQVENWITVQGKVLGVADDQLRPAYATLARVTHDVGKAQRAATLAMDISAATGRDLASVAQILSRGLGGNTAALARMSPELRAMQKSGATAQEMMQKLFDTFGGAAQANADTVAGKMQKLRVRMDELKESIGYKLLPVMDSLLTRLDNMATWADNHPKLIERVGNAFSWLGGFVFKGMVAPVMAVVNAIKLIPNETSKALTGADISRFNGWSNSISAAGNSAQQASNKISTLAKTTKDKLASALDQAKNKLQSVKDQMKAFTDQVASTVSGFATLGGAFDKAAASEADYQTALKERADAYAELDMAKQGDDTKAYASALERVAKAEQSVTDAGKNRKSYAQVFGEQIAAAKSFAGNLKKLSQMGLGAAGIQQLLDMGPIAGAGVAQDLLSGIGGLTIGGINASLAELSAAGAELGAQVGGGIYGSDLLAAQGDVNAISRARVSGTTNVSIVVNGGDPDAVVAALRKYMAQKGAVPIKVTNK